MLRILVAALSVLFCVSPALSDEAKVCGDWKNTPPDRSITSCSAVISGNPKAHWAYLNRGLAYANKGDKDRAKYVAIGEADNFVLKFRKPK